MISGKDFEKVVGILSPEVQAFDRMAGELRADHWIVEEWAQDLVAVACMECPCPA
jgi:hypothetical protein